MEITRNVIVNCKAGLKLKTTKHCVLAVAGNDTTNGNPNNIIFTIKDTKLYVPVVTLSVKYNSKLSKLLSKGFERSVYWSEYKTEKVKMEVDIDIFSNQILLESIDYLF